MFGDQGESSTVFCDFRSVVLGLALLCVWTGLPSAPSQLAYGQASDVGGDSSTSGNKADIDVGETGFPDTVSFESPRQTLRTFVFAMERKDFANAVKALDFSAIDPTPDSFEQVRYAEQLKNCMDRLALPDPSLFSDEPGGPPASFPPDSTDAAISLARGEDGQWRFTPGTVANISKLYQVLKTRPIIGSEVKPKVEEPESEKPQEASEETEKEAKGSASADRAAQIPPQLSSARRTMHTLFDALESGEWKDAVSALDFSSLESPEVPLSPYVKIPRVRRLKEVVERLAPIDYAEISDDPEGPRFFFPPGSSNPPIEISHNADGVWRFSADTVSQIDALYELHKDKPILNLSEEDKPWYQQELILGNETWRILLLFAAVFISLVLGNLLRAFMLRRAATLEKREARSRATVTRTIATTSVGAFFLVGLTFGLSWLILDHSVSELVRTVIHIVFALVIGYICFRLVDVVVEMLRGFAERSGSTLNNMLAPIISMSLRLTIVILVLLEIATAISDQPPSAVLAGLGAGGLAIGLAAQETIKNLFGSIMIFADHPFEIGDRIVVDGHDGPVESVGFRSTRIRTLEGNLVTVPNGELANRTIQNVGKRPYIRRVMNVHLAYDLNPEKIDRALEIVRDILANHEGMSEDRPPRVFLEDFLDSAINLRVFYWFHPPDFWEFTRFGEEVNLQLIKRFHAEGIRFALPSQRLFVSNAPDAPTPDGPFDS